MSLKGSFIIVLQVEALKEKEAMFLYIRGGSQGWGTTLRAFYRIHGRHWGEACRDDLVSPVKESFIHLL